MDIPKLSLDIFKHNHPDYTSLSEDSVLDAFSTSFDVFKLPKLANEDLAAELIQTTIDNGKRILVVCDIDCDGLSAAAIAYKTLKTKTSNFDVIHGHRLWGRGFCPKLVSKIQQLHDEQPIDLIITADHCSNDLEACKTLKAYGIPHIIITDHHEITTGPGDVDVFVNDQQVEDGAVGYCGAAVLFKVLSNLHRDDVNIYDSFYKPCLPHAAIATVTDVMPLNIDYNRKLIRAGLQIMNLDTHLWSMLIDKLNIPVRFSYKDFGYVLGPFINTGNRANKEGLYYRILIEEDPTNLARLIEQGKLINTKRKEVKKECLTTVLSTLASNSIKTSLALIVETPMAINGIIASSLGDKFNVPVTCFVTTENPKVLSGSSRGIVDHMDIAKIYAEIAEIDKDMFIGYGGHRGAGGCAIPFDKFGRFKELFDEVTAKVTVPKDYAKEEYIIDIDTKSLTTGIVDEIMYAGPYGKDWLMPKFRGMFKIKSIIPLNSLAIVTFVTNNGKVIKGTYFYRSDELKSSVEYLYQRGMTVRVIFEPQYYRRYNKIEFTMVVDSLLEM